MRSRVSVIQFPIAAQRDDELAASAAPPRLSDTDVWPYTNQQNAILATLVAFWFGVLVGALLEVM